MVAVTHPPDSEPELPFLARFQHSKIHRSPGLYMQVAAHRANEFFYADSRLALICNADVVDPLPVRESPASMLAHLYQKRGDRFVLDLHGWFGIILYDYEQGQLKAWTDHFGVRRIVYAQTAAGLVIGSDLRALLPFTGSQPEIDPAAIVEYLRYTCIPAPRTIYKGCLRLEPGHILRSKPAPVSEKYWDITYVVSGGKGERQWAKETEKAIRNAVALYTRTSDPDSRLGCFLSGGTDSSSVSGLLGQSTGVPPKTFSIGFEDPRYNESNYARISADYFHADHHEYFVKPQDIVDLIPKALAAYDEPFGNSSIIPSYYCARLAAQNGITHLLAGDGGDELFGGNQRYASDKVFQRYKVFPYWLRRRIIEPSLRCVHLPILEKASRYVRRANIPVPDRWHSYDFLSSVDNRKIFSDDFLADLNGLDSLAASKRHYASAHATDDLNRYLYMDVKITLTDDDLRKVTTMSELAGVVPRYPLLDPALAEFSGTIPSNLKVRGTQLRYLFKKAMADILPAEVIRKKKHGFGLPFSVWLNGIQQLRELTLDTLRSKACRERLYFRENLIDSLWSNYQDIHPTFYGDVIWLFLMLELWHLSVAHPSREAAS